MVAELSFTKHRENCSKRKLKKLRILKNHSGTNWVTNPKTFKINFTTLIRPNIEYAEPIWAHASKTALKILIRFRQRL